MMQPQGQEFEIASLRHGQQPNIQHVQPVEKIGPEVSRFHQLLERLDRRTSDARLAGPSYVAACRLSIAPH
jgi:hypothetical protein